MKKKNVVYPMKKIYIELCGLQKKDQRWLKLIFHDKNINKMRQKPKIKNAKSNLKFMLTKNVILVF